MFEYNLCIVVQQIARNEQTVHEQVHNKRGVEYLYQIPIIISTYTNLTAMKDMLPQHHGGCTQLDCLQTVPRQHL